MVAVLLVRSPFLSLYLPLWFPSTSHYISIFPLICQSYPIQIYQNEILILATNSIGISINVLLVYPDGGFFLGTQVPPYPASYRGNTQGDPRSIFTSHPCPPRQASRPSGTCAASGKSFSSTSARAARRQRMVGSLEALGQLVFFFHHKPRWMFFCCFKMGISWDNGIHDNDAGGPSGEVGEHN